MNRNKKMWLLPVVLCILLAFLLSYSCGRKEKAKGENGKEAGQVSQKVKQEKVIKIGAILPLTGDFALFGGWLKEGIEFASSESQVPVQVTFEDNANQTTKAVSAYQKLVNIDKVQAVIAARTPVANALTPLTKNAKVFTIFTFADLPRGDKTYILNYHFPVVDEVKALTEFAYRNLGTRGAILVVNDDFGCLGSDLFTQAFEKIGGKIVYSQQFSSIERDFRPLLLKLKNLHPDFVFVIAWEQNFIVLTKQIKEMNINLPIIGPNVLTIYLNLVKSYLPRSYFTMSLYDTGKSTGPQYKQFLRNYKTKKAKEPNMVIAESYEATKILLKALKEESNNLSKFFSNFKKYTGIFGKVKIDDKRQAHFPLAVVEIKGGKKVKVVWKFIP